MALQCAVEIPGTGIILNYWRIVSFSFNADARSFFLTLAGYVSQAERLAGSRPLPEGLRYFNWQGDDNPVTIPVIVAGTAFSAVYTKIKQSVMSTPFVTGALSVETNPFVNATDVL